MASERRAPVQGTMASYIKVEAHLKKPQGTVAWWEHEKAWEAYAKRYGRDQSAERIAQRTGFCYAELTEFLGHEPETWLPLGHKSTGEGE